MSRNNEYTLACRLLLQDSLCLEMDFFYNLYLILHFSFCSEESNTGKEETDLTIISTTLI